MESNSCPHYERRRLLIFHFKSFQTRILFFFLGLIILILTVYHLSLTYANNKNAENIITNDLERGSKIFGRLMNIRAKQLADSAWLLSGDYAFKTAFSTGDEGTIMSALQNHQARIQADVMSLISEDGYVFADTLQPELLGEEYQFPNLLEKAEDEGHAYALCVIGGKTYQVVLVPLLAPMPVAWISIGFLVADNIATDLKKLADMEVSFFVISEDQNLKFFASTFNNKLRQKLNATISKDIIKDAKSTVKVLLNGELLLTRSMVLGKTPDGVNVYALLQRSLTKILEPYERLQFFLLALSFVALLSSIVFAILIAKSVSKPVTTLVRGVREIEDGNFFAEVTVNQHDEMGTLASAINQMSKGLAEKEKVRNLLGKVVSPSVAHELMNKELELGGEEKVITAFFSDIAGFTSVSEKLTPTELVELLNEYLSNMTDIINGLDGTVDKFIGDAIVAFWGAPLEVENHAELTVTAAIRIQKRLLELQKVWKEQGKPPLNTRIGINTGLMIAGNMGSKERMDYTIIGDAVNLAARLEGANKYYGTKIIVSEFTHVQIKGKFLCRELDMVRVQGKEKAIRIYEVIDERREVSEKTLSHVLLFEQALDAFRKLELEKAKELFERYSRTLQEHKATESYDTGDEIHYEGDASCMLYLSRIEELKASPPDKDWDRVYALAK